MSADRSADPRKRALRLLAREHLADYAAIYEELRPTARSSLHARDLARTRLRSRFPDRYRELYDQELGGPRTDVPAAIRSKSWQRATARLAELRPTDYQRRYGQFRAQGMNQQRATARAMAALREANGDLFDRLLTEECQLWLVASAADEPTPGAPHDSGLDPGT